MIPLLHYPQIIKTFIIVAGEGDQAGIIWQHRERIKLVGGEEVINSILKHLGVVARKGEDEFLTMGFGLRRFTDDWIKT